MIKYIILGIILLLVVSYFGFSVQEVVEAPLTQNNFSYVWNGITYVWNQWLAAPILYFWHNIFVGLLWNSFIHNLGKINEGAPTELEAAASRLLETGQRPYQPIAE